MSISKFRFKEIVLISFCLLFSAILYYRDITGANFNKMYLVVATICAAVLLDYKCLLYLLCFIFPLSCGIPSNYIYPLLILILLLKDNTLCFRKIIFFVVILFLEIIHYAFYTFDIEIAEIVGYSSFLFLLSYIVADNSKDLNHGKCLLYFCCGVGVLLLGIVMNTNILLEQMPEVNEGLRIGETKNLGDFDEQRMMLSLNANTIGYYSIAAISCLLVLQYYRKINIILFLILIAITFYGGILSISRTWALLLVVSVITYMIMMKQDRAKGLIMIAIFCVGALVFIAKNPMILDSFMERFIGDATNLATAGDRTTIFQQYNDYLANNPISLIFGTGAVYYGEVTRLELSTHNATQQILVSYGLLGLGIFIVALFKSIKKHFNNKNLMAILPLFIMILFVQTIQILNPYYLMCPIIVAFFALKMGASRY